MAEKRIEAKIREHYVSESGEWLVEKGKVKEAKLLKEACHEIERLRKEASANWRHYMVVAREREELRASVSKREAELVRLEAQTQEKLKATIKSLQKLVSE